MTFTASARYLVANVILWCGFRMLPDGVVRRDLLKLLRLYGEGRTSPEQASALLRMTEPA